MNAFEAMPAGQAQVGIDQVVIDGLPQACPENAPSATAAQSGQDGAADHPGKSARRAGNQANSSSCFGAGQRR